MRLFFPALLLALGLPTLLFGQTETSQADLYQKSIADAQNPEPTEVVKTLIPLIPKNANTVWKTIDGEKYVLVVSWKTDASWYPESGPYNTGARDLWVTPVPQLLEVCGDAQWIGSETLSDRLMQYLGLPPGSSNAYFIEFWVKPEDLFRPCPDAEVTDKTCGTNWPKKTDPAHREWINDLRSVQYFTAQEPNNTPYPWTQLGYTYDWNASNTTHVGASEYVVYQNRDIIVKKAYTTEEYCTK